MSKNVKNIVVVQKYNHPTSDGHQERLDAWRRTQERYATMPDVESDIYDEIGVYSKENKVVAEFVKGDCIDSAIKLKKEGYNPLLLNMADWRYAGGLVDTGCPTQEEELFRRSNYFKLLQQKYYPMKPFRTIVSKGVEFWLDGMYNEVLEKHFIDCVAAPALCGPWTTPDLKNYLKEEDADKMEKKIRMLFYAAERSGNDSVVLSAWGCGAYSCPIYGTARLFKKVIDEGTPVKKILFAITGNRFEPFVQAYLE